MVEKLSDWFEGELYTEGANVTNRFTGEEITLKKLCTTSSTRCLPGSSLVGLAIMNLLTLSVISC